MPAEQTTSGTVAVIGAGVIGIATALNLLRQGRDVVLVDRLEPGEGASFGNAGVLASSSIIPVTVPGLMFKVPKMLADPLGPVYLRWSYLPRMMPWLFKYLRHCTEDSVRHIARHMAPMTADSLDEHQRLAQGTAAAERITTTLLVPTMVNILLDHPKLDQTDLSSLELLIYGAAPMSPTRLLEGLERIGPVFCQLYGQTEGYPLTVLRKGDHNKDDPGLFAACGHPVSSVRIALLDEEGQEVPGGEVGEICAQGPQIMDAYWQRPEQTEEVFAHGWLHTGDMAWADDRGYLYIVDRKKDMIITGGFNVFPREVEDVITTDRDIAMAAVIGVPDDKWGEAVKAVVVVRAGAQIDTEALIQRVKDSKGAVQAPKSVDIVDEIPLTPLGKPDKKALREIYWAGRDRRVG
ncbi:MAG: FAD-dependent oxidoreductase [Rhodospirillaceae bacterium]|nr:FAD-dependent oxidoreductase [Rhodospirillaceae bacterium]